MWGRPIKKGTTWCLAVQRTYMLHVTNTRAFRPMGRAAKGRGGAATGGGRGRGRGRTGGRGVAADDEGESPPRAGRYGKSREGAEEDYDDDAEEGDGDGDGDEEEEEEEEASPDLTRRREGAGAGRARDAPPRRNVFQAPPSRRDAHGVSQLNPSGELIQTPAGPYERAWSCPRNIRSSALIISEGASRACGTLSPTLPKMRARPPTLRRTRLRLALASSRGAYMAAAVRPDLLKAPVL